MHIQVVGVCIMAGWAAYQTARLQWVRVVRAVMCYSQPLLKHEVLLEENQREAELILSSVCWQIVLQLPIVDAAVRQRVRALLRSCLSLLNRTGFVD